MNEDGIKQLELTEIRYNGFESAAPEGGRTSMKLGDRGDKVYFTGPVFSATVVGSGAFHAIVIADDDERKCVFVSGTGTETGGSSSTVTVLLLGLLAVAIIDAVLAPDGARE